MVLNKDFMKLSIIIVGALALLYVFKHLSHGRLIKNDGNVTINADEADKADKKNALIEEPSDIPQAGRPVTLTGAGFEGLSPDELQKSCFPTEKELRAQDLLPKNEFAGWADVHPGGVGVLEDKNFLHAGHHIGINTVGQSLRNANYNFRSEPPNPQVQVSPWQQTTIGPDNTRRPLEIGYN